MFNLSNLIELARERAELNGQFGNLSCLQYPKQYDRMDEIGIEIRKACEKEFSGIECNIIPSDVEEAIKDIGDEVYRGNLSFEYEAPIFWTQADFIEEVVKAKYQDEKQREAFEDAFDFLDEDTRAAYLFSKYTSHSNNYYHDRLHRFIIDVCQ